MALWKFGDVFLNDAEFEEAMDGRIILAFWAGFSVFCAYLMYFIWPANIAIIIGVVIATVITVLIRHLIVPLVTFVFGLFILAAVGWVVWVFVF